MPSLRSKGTSNDRISPVRAFLVSVLGYVVLFLLKDRKTRISKFTMAYITLFVCICTKAMHIEIIIDLTTKCFIENSADLYSAGENMFRNILTKHLHLLVLQMGFQNINRWIKRPKAPHFGGLWESGVKVIKSYLKRVISIASLAYEEFSSVLCPIEACLNFRPPIWNEPTFTTNPGTFSGWRLDDSHIISIPVKCKRKPANQIPTLATMRRAFLVPLVQRVGF